MSGGEVVGGEKRELILRVNAESIEGLPEAVMVAVRTALTAEPEQIALVG